MLRKTAVLFCFLFLFAKSVFSQETILTEKINSTKIQAQEFLGFDNQQNFYTTKDNVLFKNNTQNHFEYKNVSLGKITQVDFQNPLQIVVFYNDFNTTILLDNQLNETKKINFNHLSEPVNIGAIALSSQNKLWFFDTISSKIGLYDLTKDTFYWISTSLENPIKYYHSNYTNFYWLDTKNKLYSISIYGTIKALTELPNFDNIQLINDEIAIYSYENQLYYYKIKTNTNLKIKIAENFATNFFFADGILAIFTQNEITNYKIILP
jgi:hypothetical protein